MNRQPSLSENSIIQCRRKLTEGDRTDYYSALFAPSARRLAITALYALWREIQEVVHECREPEVAQRKLGWWREEIDRLYAGEPRHPATTALAPALADIELPKTRFVALINELVLLLQAPHFPTSAEWHEHTLNTRGQLLRLIATLCGHNDGSTVEHAGHLGSLQAQAMMLRDIGADARNGFVFLPQDQLDHFGVRTDDIYAGRASDALSALLQAEIKRILGDTTQWRLATSDRHQQLPLLIATNVTTALLEEIRTDAARVLTHRIALTPLRQLWIAWRTSRRERRRR